MQYTISISTEQWRAFKQACALRGVTMSAVMRKMIEQYVEKENGK